MFPIKPVKGEIYIVANKEWLFNGYGFTPVPDSSLSEESDPIWNSEKHEYAKKTELEDYVPLDVLDSTLTDYVPLDTLDSTLIDYVKQEEISDIIPQFQKTITQDQFVWYNDYLVIDIEEISHSKKVTILSLYIYTSKGIIKGTSIVSYPTIKERSNILNFTYFYLKDTLGIISKANDIEKISISYNISNQDKEVDIQGTLGRNILFEENAGEQAHGKFVMNAFHGVYPENTHQKILSIDLPEVTGNVRQEFQPYICSKYGCNLVAKPYVGAATSENYLSNPEILTIGAHYNNNNIRRNITSGPDKFLSNTVAVSAGQNKDDTTSLWTSYGYGVEFFESWAKEEIDQRYPNKLFDHAIARIITTPDNQGLIYKSSGIGWSAIVEVGQIVRIRYSASNDVEVTVTSIVSDDEIRINQTVAPILETDSDKYLYTYVTVGAIGYYRPQQSPTCGMVAAKFREIQDKTNANWQVCREAARATASNSTFTLEGTDKVWTTNWDMHRGFGIIDVDSAVEYIHQHYIDNVDYKKSAAYTLPKSNPFLGVDDIERDTFVSKANLEEYVARSSGNASLPQNISDALDNSVNPSAVNPFTTKTELDTAVFNDLEIGGRNLILDSEKILHKDNKLGSSAIAIFTNNFLFKRNSEYVFSFDIKGTGVTSFVVGNYTYPVSSIASDGQVGSDNGGLIFFNTTERYNRIWIKIKTDNWSVEELAKPINLFVRESSEAWVKNVKLEKGTKATDWSPNPDDLKTWVLEKFSEHPITIEGGIIDGGDSSD